MDENTAFRLGRDWLTRARASDDGLPVIASSLQRIAAQPSAHALAIDNRLALLADQALWIVTITAAEDDVTTVEIERVELGAERVRVALTAPKGDGPAGRCASVTATRTP